VKSAREQITVLQQQLRQNQIQTEQAESMPKDEFGRRRRTFRLQKLSLRSRKRLIKSRSSTDKPTHGWRKQEQFLNVRESRRPQLPTNKLRLSLRPSVESKRNEVR
jgi:hypothetical protein